MADTNNTRTFVEQPAFPTYNMVASMYAPRETDPLLRVLHDLAHTIAALSDGMADGTLDAMDGDAREGLSSLCGTLAAHGWMDPYRKQNGSLSIW